MNKIVPDSKLVDLNKISDRMESIKRQLARLDEVWNPRDYEKHHAKYSRLTARYDSLWIKRASMLKIGK